MTLEEFKRFLRSENLRLTRPRRLVFEEVLSLPKIHPNADDIYKNLQKKEKKVSRASIYRTLHLLVKSGLVSQIDLGEQHSHYELEGTDAGHGHLVCLSCGKVKEFSRRQIHGVLNRMSRENKFKVERFSVQIFGFCEECQKKEEKSKRRKSR